MRLTKGRGLRVFLLSHDGSWDNSVLKLDDTLRAMCSIILEVKK
jgi:hypothetical protein